MAKVMQLAVTSPSINTVQAEQAPRSHPIFAPVNFRSCRRTSTSVAAGSMKSETDSPLIERVNHIRVWPAMGPCLDGPYCRSFDLSITAELVPEVSVR